MKCKLAIGIMEFFLDAVSFNANHEFGDDSLYLCSPIEYSFGYTPLNDVKLLNYDQIFTGKQLQALLSTRFCKSDSDCVYNEQCGTQCDNITNTCTFYLVKPQIVDFCLYLNRFINSDKADFKLALEKCLELNTLKEEGDVLFKNNLMPVDAHENETHQARSRYWADAGKYVEITNEIYSLLWQKARHC